MCKHYYFGSCNLTEPINDNLCGNKCDYAEEAGVDFIDCPDYEEEENDKTIL